MANLIVGYNPSIKQEINIGGRNNQNFVQIPFHSLCSKLNYQEQDESYTFKASAPDCDEIPVYNADNPKEYQFSGNGIQRGLYRTKTGHLVNADLNRLLTYQTNK
jgi:hypothetical protein